ncbi:LOW QUALITY PROTEIN: nucleoporin NUP35 [Aplochiton taeniatus]
MELQGTEPMTLGSPTSPKPGPGGAQFLPGFLMGDLPAPVTPQSRSFALSGGVMELRSPSLAGGSPPQPVVPPPKDKSGAPPIRSIYDDLSSPAPSLSPLSSHRQPFTLVQTPLAGYSPATPTTAGSVCASLGRQVLSPAQVDPFFTQGDELSSEDQLDDTWVTVFGFPPASASFILLQFAQYGNILKNAMSNTGNWMHLQYQSKLQARKALSKDGKVFGESIMVGVKPCIHKVTVAMVIKLNPSVMEGSDRGSVSRPAPRGTPSTPRTSMRPLSAAYKASSSDYQVVADRQTPRRDDSLVSKAMEYMFGW